MNERDDGGPAFPTAMDGGMSLRDYFAAATMTGLCANTSLTDHCAAQGYDPADVRVDYARTAYATADAMLAERAK